MDGVGEFKEGILGDMLPGGAIESRIWAAPMHGLEGREGWLYKVLLILLSLQQLMWKCFSPMQYMRGIVHKN